MANRNRTERDTLSRDREQPEGWFDPERYRQSLENRERGKSNYQQTNNPNLVNRYDDLNRQRIQNQYSDRTAFNRQYGRDNQDSRNTFNDSSNIPSSGYGDSFDEGYATRGNQQTYRDRSQFDTENRYGMSGRYDDNRFDRDTNYRTEDRDWWDRATDEVSSWFGDDDAERRRRMDKMKGPHSGKGPKGYLRTDDKLKDDINERLYHDSHIDASDIEVQVLNGEATLTGTVENKMVKRRIEDIIESIPGITDVENRIKIKATSNTVGSYSNGDFTRKGSTNGGR